MKWYSKQFIQDASKVNDFIALLIMEEIGYWVENQSNYALPVHRVWYYHSKALEI